MAERSTQLAPLGGLVSGAGLRVLCQCRQDLDRDAARTFRAQSDARDAHLRGQVHTGALRVADALVKHQASTFGLQQIAADVELRVEVCRSLKFERHRVHDEGDVERECATLLQTGATQVFGPGPLQEAEVGGVVHDAARICIF